MTDTIFITAMLALALAFAYVLGRLHQHTRDRRAIQIPIPVGLVDEFAHVPTDIAPPELAAVETVRMEITGYLDPATGPVTVAEIEPVVEAPRYGELAVPVPLDDVRLLAVQADRDRWRERFERAERLRARYLRLLRVERKRLTYMLGDVMDAPRRPRKLTLVAVQLPLPDGRHLSLVPPVKAREWREEALAS